MSIYVAKLCIGDDYYNANIWNTFSVMTIYVASLHIIIDDDNNEDICM